MLPLDILGTTSRHTLDTTMSRATHNATYDAPLGSQVFRDPFSATPNTADPQDEAIRLQLAMWREQARRSYERPNASWTTHWISRSLFILGVLAIGTVTYYVFSGESSQRSTENRLITRQQSTVSRIG